MLTSSEIIGGILWVVNLSALFTLIISFFLLRIYRRSVLKNMNAISLSDNLLSGDGNDNDQKQNNTCESFQPVSEAGKTNKPTYREVFTTMHKRYIWYIAGGLVYAAVLSFAWMYAADKSIYPIRFLFLLVCFSWPVIVTIRIKHLPASGKYVLGYILIFILLVTVSLIKFPDILFYELFLLWLIINGPGTIYLFFISNRKIRSVGPLVFTFVITAFTGAFVLYEILWKSERWIALTSDLASRTGLNAAVIIVFFVIAGLVLFAPLGWLFIRWIGRRYQRKKMSDQTLRLDTLWIIFGFFHSFTLIHNDLRLAFAGFAAFTALKITQWIIRLLSARFFKKTSDRILLLLRIFSLGKKSEYLFDATTSMWLLNGSMCFLSGPDLATSTLEPQRFYDFIAGRLSRQFIHDENDLQQKISNMDLLPDPDGRYRINEFFCMSNTWQPTMQSLAGKCSTVLMDMRSYSEKNKASTFEIKHLLNTFPLRQVVFLTDRTTDTTYLKTTIGTILGNPGNTSINAGMSVNDLHMVEFRKNNRQEMQKLLELLFSI